MELEHLNHDDAIDQTLAALKAAAPPEGMEARILQRLQQPVPAAPFRWRELLTGSALATAWWRGALSGAATAMLIVGALLLAQHGLRARPHPAVSQIAPCISAPAAVPVVGILAACCCKRLPRQAHAPLRESCMYASPPRHAAPPC